MPRAKKSPATAKPRRASKKKRTLADLPPQLDPRAVLHSALLIAALEPARKAREEDPKQPVISYPGCESEEHGEPVYGWAGRDYSQRAAAIVALCNDRKTRDGLVPTHAGLLELLPWLKQWHSGPMPDYDTTVAEAYGALLYNELRELALTREDLSAWRSPERCSPGRWA